jgi:hypothetical protein
MNFITVSGRVKILRAFQTSLKLSNALTPMSRADGPGGDGRLQSGFC